jgi:hypothetical protein
MAKTVKAVPAVKPVNSKFAKLLADNADARQECGLTLSDAQLEFIVKLVIAAS